MPGRSRPPRTPARAGARRTGMHPYQPPRPRPPRRNTPLIVIAVLFAVAVVLAGTTIVRRFQHDQALQAAGGDRAAVTACEKVRDGGATGDRDALAAIDAAVGSDSPALREAAARYLDEPDRDALDQREAMLRIARWCLETGVGSG